MPYPIQSLSFFITFIIVVILFVASSSSSSKQHQPLHFVSAKKEVFIPKPIKEAIPIIRCSVCEHTMFQLVRNTLDYISENGVKHKLKEEKLIDKIFEPICAPLRPGGSWLRGADWEVQDSKTQALISSAQELTEDSIFQFKLRDTHERTFKCGKRCATAAAACDLIMRGGPSGSEDIVGRITSILMKHFPKLLKAVEKEEQDQRLTSDDRDQIDIDIDAEKIDIDPEKEMIELAKILVLQICRKKPRISGCTSSSSKKNNNNNNKNGQKISAKILHADPIEEMEIKEVEVEEMMWRMKYGFKDSPASASSSSGSDKKQKRYDLDDDDDSGPGSAGNPGMDVYSKEEMMKLREALKNGDRETLRELDPQSDELSDEEFDLLTGMHRKEFGGGN